MDKNLDSYLENLGISDDAESKAPVLPSGTPAPNPIQNTAPQRSTNPTSSQTDPNDTDSSQERVNPNAGSADVIVEDFLGGLLRHLGSGYKVSARVRDDNVQAEIQGGDSGRIIGREGRTLASIEFLANTVVTKELGANAPRVNVDAAGYKRRHEERLLETARRAAARVRKSGEGFEMDPMSAADRRIIHIALREDAFVTTESVGEGADRRLIIKPR
jgi:spoIIIJ-associated protein